MEILSRNGAAFRTKLMDRASAERFERCLRANLAFTGVLLEESTRAKDPEIRWMVVYSPRNDARQEALYQRQQEARAERAAAEGAGYLFVLDQDGAVPFFWCQSASGEVYEVASTGCSCADFHYRCSGNGLSCKHMVALRDGLSPVIGWTERVAPQAPAPVPAAVAEAARRERVRADKALWD